MSASIAASGLGDLVEANIEGGKLAKAALESIDRDVAPPDALGHALLAAWQSWGKAGLLGAARQVQKRLERAPA